MPTTAATGSPCRAVALAGPKCAGSLKASPQSADTGNVSTSGSDQETIRASEQRCRVCDADMLFLSSCVFCGTPVGEVRPPALLVPVGARVASRGAIPDELTRAWALKERTQRSHPGSRRGRVGGVGPTESVRTPVAAPDGWLAATRRSRRLGDVSRSRWALAIVLALGVAAAAVMASMTTGQLSPPSAGAPQGHHAEAPQRYDAGGWTFAADFPSAPSVVRLRSSLDGRPYIATFYSAVSPKADMDVGVYPYPIGKPTMSALTFLRRESTGAGRSPVRVRLRPRATTTFQGLPALWLATTSDGGNKASFGVIVLDGHVAYEVVLTGPSSTVNESFQQALKTFRIVDPARAMVPF